jgi:hypothetical protein
MERLDHDGEPPCQRGGVFSVPSVLEVLRKINPETAARFEAQ